MQKSGKQNTFAAVLAFLALVLPPNIHLCCYVAPFAGGLQVTCWASCFHDALEDWLHAPGPATADEHSGLGQAEQQWMCATTPTADSFRIVFAANAGLPVYPSWLPTLQQLAQLALSVALQQPTQLSHAAAGPVAGLSTEALTCSRDNAPTQAAQGVPVVFSDYCEEAAFLSGELAQKVLGKAFSLEPCLNPFRDPVPATMHGTHLPACSNAFLFGWM